MALSIRGKTRFAAGSIIRAKPFDNYKVGNFSPLLVSDFAGVNNNDNEYYRKAGSVSTFSDMFTHSRLGNATMVDSDGLIKWAPHNLATYSENFSLSGTDWSANAGASVTTDDEVAPDGAQTADLFKPSTSFAYQELKQNFTYTEDVEYTISVYARADGYDWVRLRIFFNTSSCHQLFNVATGNPGTTTANNTGNTVTPSIVPVGGGWYKLSLTVVAPAISGGGNFSVNVHDGDNATQMTGNGTSGVHFWGAHLYRSDLGGMVNNPDRGDSYVPTTSAAVHQARRNHYTYNGTSWVNSGLLLETEARTNLITQSEDFAGSYWVKTNTATLSVDSIGPDGKTSAVKLLDDNATVNGPVYIRRSNLTVSTSTKYTVSIFAKADQINFLCIRLNSFTTPASDTDAFFDLSNGITGTVSVAMDGGAKIEPYGNNGWYRCSATFTTDASDTTGEVLFLACESDGSVVVTRDGTSSILIYGAQLEEGSTPSSYIPTPGSNPDSTGTRPTESLQIAAADMPWPTPNVIGQDLVTNGTFDTDTTWTKDQGTIGGGTLNINGGAYAQIATQTLSLTSGKYYIVTFDITNRVSGGIYIGLSNGYSIGELSGNAGSNGSFTFLEKAKASDNGIYLTASPSGANLSVDNISVHEIDPLSVSLQMQGGITYADVNINPEQVFYSWGPDSGTFIRNRLITNSGTGLISLQVRDAYGSLNVFNTTGSVLAPGIQEPFNQAFRVTSVEGNIALDGTSGTAIALAGNLPDLSGSDFYFGPGGAGETAPYMGTIAQFRAWNVDIGDSGIEQAST